MEAESLKRVVGSRLLFQFWITRGQHLLTLVPSQYGSRILQRGRRIEASLPIPDRGVSAFSPQLQVSVKAEYPREGSEGSSDRGFFSNSASRGQHFLTRKPSMKDDSRRSGGRRLVPKPDLGRKNIESGPGTVIEGRHGPKLSGNVPP